MAEGSEHLSRDIVINPDATSLTLNRPLEEIVEPQRTAVAAWLAEHQIDPARVALGTAVERHEASSSISWREEDAGGLIVHRTFPAVHHDEGWPAPFPDVLMPLALLRSSPHTAG